MNILFVCLGNICRSPLAAGIMQDLYDERALPGLIESAGTADFNIGRAADHRSIAVAHEFGIDIRPHRARQLCIEDFKKFDYIFAMDRHNKANILKFAPDEASKRKVELLADQIEVADPYSSDIAAFRRAYHLMKEHCLIRLELHPKFKR